MSSFNIKKVSHSQICIGGGQIFIFILISRNTTEFLAPPLSDHSIILRMRYNKYVWFGYGCLSDFMFVLDELYFQLVSVKLVYKGL